MIVETSKDYQQLVADDVGVHNHLLYTEQIWMNCSMFNLNTRKTMLVTETVSHLISNLLRFHLCQADVIGDVRTPLC